MTFVRTRSNWILTFTGRQFWPLDPRPEEIDLRDIAHALAMKVRYTGHCKRFYSIAEHSILVSRLVPGGLAREGLMHDATEAYLPDVASPVKPDISGFREIEHRVEAAVWERFKLASPANHPSIKEVDRRLAVTERDHNMAKSPWLWDAVFDYVRPYLSLEFPYWSPAAAEYNFLQRCKELGIS